MTSTSLIKYKKLPKLTSKEKLRYIRLFYETNEIKYKNIVIESCLLLAIKEANKYTGFLKNSSLTHEDLIQAANIGLLKSLEEKRFDLSRGVPFVPYALIWIKSELKELVGKDTFRHMTPPNIDFATHYMAFNRGAMAKLSKASSEKEFDLAVKEVAFKYPKVNEKQVIAFAKYLKDYKGISSFLLENETNSYAPDLTTTIENKRKIKKVIKIIKTLPSRQKELLTKKYLLSSDVVCDATLARHNDVTRQAVSLTKLKAFKIIKTKFAE